jgi:hypothetical protein
MLDLRKRHNRVGVVSLLHLNPRVAARRGNRGLRDITALRFRNGDRFDAAEHYQENVTRLKAERHKQEHSLTPRSIQTKVEPIQRIKRGSGENGSANDRRWRHPRLL